MTWLAEVYQTDFPKLFYAAISDFKTGGLLDSQGILIWVIFFVFLLAANSDCEQIK